MRMNLRNFGDYRLIYKAFSLSTVFRCGLGTIYTALKGVRKKTNVPMVTFLTFSIFPELTRIWYYFASKICAILKEGGLSTELLVVDCGGNLNPENFSNASVRRYFNDAHPRKLGFFFRYYIKSPLVLVSDDDCFLLEESPVREAVINMWSDSSIAVWSFFPRPDWWLTVGEERVRPMGSYCLLVNRDIILKEGLSFKSPKAVNPHNNRSYDTGDYMHEQLVAKGYKVILPPGQTRSSGIGGFRGSSLWKVLAWGCSRIELRRYFATPFSYEYHYRHNLKSFYIAARVFDLYSRIFQEKPIPLFKEGELREFSDSVPEMELKEAIRHDLEWVDESYLELIDRLHA